MKAYRWSVRLKLGLIVFAVVIAVASFIYTQRLVNRLREREQTIMELWADAQAEVVDGERSSVNPYRSDLRELRAFLRTVEETRSPDAPVPEKVARFQEAIKWAQRMPPAGASNFILDEILEPDPFSIPAIIADSARKRPLFWRNVGVDETSLGSLSPEDSADAMTRLKERRREMESSFDPLPIRVDLPKDGNRLTQYIYYDESALITELRIFPWVQLLFVGLFVMVGYFGFSYVRRSEQSNLWMGMAREAAHQLGTPLSSLMGWLEMLRSPSIEDAQREEILKEIESDVERLRRVADRFSDIGSQPKLERRDIVPIIDQTASYLRRRMPRRGSEISLVLDLPDSLEVPVNEELFAWVLENLLKNALDAIQDEGRITLSSGVTENRIYLDVSDTGSGVERREQTNIFRPGYSTKERGWGLGLSLARRVIETYHGGRLVLLQSSPGEGSTFRIELPR